MCPEQKEQQMKRPWSQGLWKQTSEDAEKTSHWEEALETRGMNEGRARHTQCLVGHQQVFNIWPSPFAWQGGENQVLHDFIWVWIAFHFKLVLRVLFISLLVYFSLLFTSFVMRQIGTNCQGHLCKWDQQTCSHLQWSMEGLFYFLLPFSLGML